MRFWSLTRAKYFLRVTSALTWQPFFSVKLKTTNWSPQTNSLQCSTDYSTTGSLLWKTSARENRRSLTRRRSVTCLKSVPATSCLTMRDWQNKKRSASTKHMGNKFKRWWFKYRCCQTATFKTWLRNIGTRSTIECSTWNFFVSSGSAWLSFWKTGDYQRL